ncbi:hypothetical protein D1007_37686 [Hordeum vulgare]|nr:hypothetical protein D1007_37686 [Hordeum vulgare]
MEEGKEGPFFPVLIHLDEVKDYTPLLEGNEGGEWPRINHFRDWRMGIKDGESRGRAAAPAVSFHSGRRRDEDRDDGGAHQKRDINVRLGFIKRSEEFTDDTLLAYLQFFRAPMPSENVAKLGEIAGLSSPSELRLPDSELQAILKELAGRAF